MQNKVIIITLLFFSCNLPVFSQQGGVKDFKLINAVNKNEVSLSDFNNKKVIAVIFTSNYCPYSKLYEQRILDLHKRFAGQSFQILLINPNNPEKSKDDSIEKMAQKARDKKFPFPYLVDKNQLVCKQFGATKTPEAFLLAKKGNSFQIVYHGAIDDNPQVPQDVTNAYISDAIVAALGGKAVRNAKTRATGCVIKMN